MRTTRDKSHGSRVILILPTHLGWRARYHTPSRNHATKSSSLRASARIQAIDTTNPRDCESFWREDMSTESLCQVCLMDHLKAKDIRSPQGI